MTNGIDTCCVGVLSLCVIITKGLWLISAVMGRFYTLSHEQSMPSATRAAWMVPGVIRGQTCNSMDIISKEVSFVLLSQFCIYFMEQENFYLFLFFLTSKCLLLDDKTEMYLSQGGRVPWEVSPSTNGGRHCLDTGLSYLLPSKSFQRLILAGLACKEQFPVEHRSIGLTS